MAQSPLHQPGWHLRANRLLGRTALVPVMESLVQSLLPRPRDSCRWPPLRVPYVSFSWFPSFPRFPSFPLACTLLLGDSAYGMGCFCHPVTCRTRLPVSAGSPGPRRPCCMFPLQPRLCLPPSSAVLRLGQVSAGKVMPQSSGCPSPCHLPAPLPGPP